MTTNRVAVPLSMDTSMATTSTQSIVIVQPTPPDDGIRRHFHHKQSAFLGGAQIVVGTLSIVFGALAMTHEAALARMSAGLWCGVVCMLAGVAGIIAGGHRRESTITAFLGLSSWGAAVSTCLFFISALGLGLDLNSTERNRVHMALNSLLMLTAAFQFILSLWGILLSGCEVCCQEKEKEKVDAYNGMGQLPSHLPDGLIVHQHPETNQPYVTMQPLALSRMSPPQPPQPPDVALTPSTRSAIASPWQEPAAQNDGESPSMQPSTLLRTSGQSQTGAEPVAGPSGTPAFTGEEGTLEVRGQHSTHYFLPGNIDDER